LAKPLETNNELFNTAETIWSGTPMYMAPERFRSPEKNDPRSDIYAIGCIAYFLISGHPPFAECDPESMFALIMSDQPIRMSTHRGSDVPDELVEIVRRCMAKSADARFQTVDEVAAELDRIRIRYPWSVDEAKAWWGVHASEQDPSSDSYEIEG
ncbi:MAG: protein kinase, partial [Planctomycetota bacterium]